MKLNFCTLFDANYLDKGIVLYNSLEKLNIPFEIYVLPMDDKCSEILQIINKKYLTVIDYLDFLDDELKEIKGQRTRAEFCWTCTAKLIKYALTKYTLDNCTYVDADLYFYSNPQILFKEMINSNAKVQIVKNNFRRYEAPLFEKNAGRFCVEFNTFLNDPEAIKVLDSWVNDCITECSYGITEDVMGDQKYLEKWPLIYSCINITKNQGAGVAPWNINKFVIKKIDGKYIVFDKESKEKWPLVFYHYQNICFLENDVYYCCDIENDNDVVRELYINYLLEIEQAKRYLKEKFNVFNRIAVHPAETEKETKLKGNSNNNLLEKIKQHGFFETIKRKLYYYRYCFFNNKYKKNRVALCIKLEELINENNAQ